MASDRISYQPTDGLSYDPLEELYWDADALDKEITRVFEVCHGCRMCFKYCDSFPSLFRYIDDEHDGDVTGLTRVEIADVMESCFQCKLCEVQCPYTPREKHEFDLDFPKLVHRWKAQETRKNGLTLRDKILRNPNATGRMARASMGMANVMNRVAAHRWFMEKLIGIHREKDLPDFASTTFEKWAEGAGMHFGPDGSETVLFPTCYVENNEPQIGRDTVEVLKANQVSMTCEKGLECCGMPAWERGDLESVQRQAKVILDKLIPHVEAGSRVVALQPSCGMMLRREYPELVAKEDRERAARLSAAVVAPAEHLWNIRKEERFNTEVQSKPDGKISYHAPCHTRATGAGFRARDVVRKILGAKIGTVMECCGHDGTFAMTVEGFEPSIRAGKRAFEGMNEAESEIWMTECSLAAIQFKQHAGKKPLHPMTLLAKAYRGDTFGPKKEGD
jgi:Fe-S oxidoreductase